MEVFNTVKPHMNNNIYVILVFALLSGCSTIRSDHTSHPAVDQALHPVDCTTNAKREECLAVVNLDKKGKKKTAKSDASEQTDRRARLAKVTENKKISDDKSKAKSEVPPAPPVAPVSTVESKPEPIVQNTFNARASPFSSSMDCVRSNLKKKDDGRTNVRSVAFELASMCTVKGAHVESVANASVALVSQNRAQKATK